MTFDRTNPSHRIALHSLGVALVAVAACSAARDDAAGAGGSGGGAGASSSTTTTTGQGGLLDQGCELDGCPAGQLCVSGACCDEQQACEAACCGAGDVCSFQKCVAPGAPCSNTSQCPDGEYCELGLGDGSTGGSCAVPSGFCLPRPPECANPGDENCVEACEYVPTATFDPTVKYAWPANVEAPVAPYPYDVMMTPLVVQLDDDDCDGEITAMDRADILVTTFSGGAWSSAGVLHALAVKGSNLTELWSAAGIWPVSALAGGDIDGVKGNEVVACGVGGTSVVAFRADGTQLWSVPSMSCYDPAIADLDGDGAPEVVVEGGILAGATGQVKSTFVPTPSGFFTVGDLDGDGSPEVVFANRAYDAQGNLLVDLGAVVTDAGYASPALVDFDLDGKPEVAATHFDSDTFLLWRYDAAQPGGYALLRAPFAADVNPGGPWGWSHGMGSITAGDFDGDGIPDAGFVGFRGYVVLSGAKLMDAAVPGTRDDLAIWWKATDEDNGSTGSAVFDFDGDGKVEVLYNDTERVHIYDGITGEDVVPPFCNTTGSQFEYPVVADVDADGQADLILVANAFANAPAGTPSYICNGTIQSGVRVFGSSSKSWVQTRPIWNQHTYHVTNVEDDGAIPAVETDNWLVSGLDNFRQNKQVGGEFGAPDAVVSVLPACSDEFGVRVIVRNLGSAPMPAGVAVNVYRDAAVPKLLGTVTTTYSLFPLQSATLVLKVGGADAADLASGQAEAFAVVDEAPKKLKECRPDNNRSDAAVVACAPPK